MHQQVWTFAAGILSTERKKSVTPIKIYKELLTFCAQVTICPKETCLHSSYTEKKKTKKQTKKKQEQKTDCMAAYSLSLWAFAVS